MTARHLLYRLRRRLMRLPVLWRLGRLLPARADLRGLLLERLPRNAHCVEIGVWKGSFSKRIIESTHPRLLHLVDPWAYQPTFPDRLYGGKDASHQNDMDAIFNEVSGTLGKLANVRVHRQRSDQFLSTSSGSFDWVYIDGDHSREAVFRDLELSWQRVKDGGIVAGDDYYWRDSDGSHPVKQAVDSFCAKMGCQFELVGNQFMIRR